MNIPISTIHPNPQQPRTAFPEHELRALADSMHRNGQVQPISVEDDGDGTYTLIDGERRWRAAQMLGWDKIKADVRPALNGTGAVERRILALVANLQRADLSPVEEGRAYEGLAELGMSNAAIAHRLGTNVVRVAHRRAMLGMEDEIQDLMDAGLLPIDQKVMSALKSVPDEHRVNLARKLARPGLGIKTVQQAAEKLNAALKAERAGGEPAMHFAARRAGSPHLPNWDALRQLGKVPPWVAVVKAANETCRTCALRPSASAVVCGSCPAVAMLAALIEASHG